MILLNGMISHQATGERGAVSPLVRLIKSSDQTGMLNKHQICGELHCRGYLDLLKINISVSAQY